MPQQCKECSCIVENEQALRSHEKYGVVLCEKHAKEYQNCNTCGRESPENIIEKATKPDNKVSNETPASDYLHGDIDKPIEAEPSVGLPDPSKYPRRPITRIQGMNLQLCERGHIKIGKKGKVTNSEKGTSFRLPEKLDHFIVTTMNRTEDDDLEIDENIMGMLGDRPREIPVTLVYDKPDLNFLTWYAYYDSAQCQCRGNGEIAYTADGRVIQCDPETCRNAINRKCKPNGILSVILTDAPGVGGVYKFRTTGWNSIRNLMSSIEFIYGLTGGRLAGLPLVLTLHPKTTLIPGTKKQTTIYMVNLEYRGTIQQLQQEARSRLIAEEKMAELEQKAVAMLSVPETPEECKDVQEEFYPETAEGDQT